VRLGAHSVFDFWKQLQRCADAELTLAVFDLAGPRGKHLFGGRIVALLPPAVIGPLSKCSSSVRVQGQLIGATVNLFANGAPVGTGLANWTD
jgi:hypothetical protein